METIFTAVVARAIAEDVLNNNLSEHIVKINKEITLAARDGKTRVAYYWYTKHEYSQKERVINFFKALEYRVTISQNGEWMYFDWAE